MWFRRKTAIHPDSGQKMSVWVGTTDWDSSLYPTLVFDHFKAVPILNTFMLMFPRLVQSTSDDMMYKVLAQGQDA